MEKPTKIAFDLGGVIVIRGALETRQNFFVQQSKACVKLTIQKFGSQNVFIISKAKQKYIQGNVELLKNNDFFNTTGFLAQNLYFVDKKQDKGPLMKKLQISYIVDDSVQVAKIASQNGFTPILFGNHQQFIKENPHFLHSKNWKEYCQLLENLKK